MKQLYCVKRHAGVGYLKTLGARLLQELHRSASCCFLPPPVVPREVPACPPAQLVLEVLGQSSVLHGWPAETEAGCGWRRQNRKVRSRSPALDAEPFGVDAIKNKVRPAPLTRSRPLRPAFRVVQLPEEALWADVRAARRANFSSL